MDELRQRAVINQTEAAAVLRLDRSTLRAAIDRGELPHVRVGPRILIPVGPLLEMLRASSGRSLDSDPVG